MILKLYLHLVAPKTLRFNFKKRHIYCCHVMVLLLYNIILLSS